MPRLAPRYLLGKAKQWRAEAERWQADAERLREDLKLLEHHMRALVDAAFDVLGDRRTCVLCSHTTVGANENRAAEHDLGCPIGAMAADVRPS